MEPSKILEASLPKILTEQVLLGTVFIILLGENYLLSGYHCSISCIDSASLKLTIKDGVYFIMSLAFCWLCIRPSIKFLMILGDVTILKLSRKPYPFRYLTKSELFKLAMESKNNVAYKYLIKYEKSLKEEQLARDSYLFIFILTANSLRYANSFMWQTLNSHPIIGVFSITAILLLGLKVGIIDNLSNDDDKTDVQFYEHVKT